METKEFYVERSAWFDTHLYNVPLIKEAVKYGGGENLHWEKQFGWINQPEVVVFSATENQLPEIKEQVQKILDTPWIIIKEKDWRLL